MARWKQPPVPRSINYLIFSFAALALPGVFAIKQIWQYSCKSAVRNNPQNIPYRQSNRPLSAHDSQSNPYRRSAVDIERGKEEGLILARDRKKYSDLGWIALEGRWQRFLKDVSHQCPLITYIAMSKIEPAEFVAEALNRDPRALNSVGFPPYPDNTPLLWAIANANNATAVTILRWGKQGKLDVDKQSGGNTALLLAVRKGHRDKNAVCIPLAYSNVHIAKKLLKMKANPNIQDNDGNTALHLAYLRREADVVALLKCHGAREDIVNRAGALPAHMGNKSLEEASQILGDPTVVSLDTY